MIEADLYTLAHPIYYERLGRLTRDPHYEQIVKGAVGGLWEMRLSDMWLYVEFLPPKPRTQGFKIHVAATIECSHAVLATVAKLCDAHRVSFKCAADHRRLALLNGKNFDRGGGGKFITIYPADDPQWLMLMGALRAAFADLDVAGQYILSDRRFPESSIVFYRYGGIQPVSRLQVDGSRSGMLIGPDGKELIDRRTPYFECPSWAIDPIPEENEDGDGAVIGGHWRVKSIITANNRGGVYLAEDINASTEVVIKEARPFVNHLVRDGVVIDSSILLRREHQLLQRLAPSGITPSPIDFFHEWEHSFLVQERVPGVPLRKALADTNNLIMPYVRQAGAIEAFVPKFARLGMSLIAAIRGIHREGIVLGDLSINNVMVDPDTWNVRIIDVESAVDTASEEPLLPFLREWATPGFVHPERHQRPGVIEADDWFAAGTLLREAIMPTNNFLYLLGSAGHPRIMRFLASVGFPSWVIECIDALRAGDHATASAQLEPYVPGSKRAA